jgi:hypothetical protein
VTNVVTVSSRFRCAPRNGTITRVGECVGFQTLARDVPGERTRCLDCPLGRRVAESVGITFGEVPNG